jgi:hypothetical protein
MKGTTKIVFGVTGLGLMGLLLLAVILGVRSFLGYTRAVGASPGGTAMSVFIQNPQPASKFEEQSLVVIDAQASGPAPVLAMELWVDGQLADVRSAPTSQGISPFQSDFTWNAAQLGVHQVFVRAVDTSGGTSSSPILPLEVVSPGTIPLEELGTAYVDPGVSVPVNSGGGGGGGGGGENPYQPVEPPELLPPEPPTEGKQWSPTIGGWIGNLFLQPLLPAAPAIPASAIEVCSPRIWISDNSDNEQGFHVYRRDPGMADFVKIDTLAAHVGAIFTFDDVELYGNYQYYVSAFNQSGEAPSNIESVNVDSANCEPESGPVITLQLAKVLSTVPLQMGYCYMSFDGENWSRYPSDPHAFLPASADGMSLEGLGVLASLADSGAPTPMDLQCWGWSGDSPQMIGEWHWGNVFDAGLNLEGIEFETLGGEAENVLGIAPELEFHILPYDARVPIPWVWLGSGPQGCADHVGGNFILLLVCADIADDLDYAVWALGECPADLCFKESDVIGYNIYDSLHDGGLTPAHTADSPISIYFMINDMSCDPRNIRVTALVEYEGEVRESYPSNQVFYNGNPNCPFLFGQETRRYEVFLDTIVFTHINDDPDVEDDAEGKGYVSLWTDSGPGKSWTLNLSPEFDDDSPQNFYYWAGLPICKGNGYPTYCSTQDLASLLGNNTSNIFLSINEGATIHVELYDYDDESGDDAICIPPDYYFNQAWVDTAPDQILHGSMSASHDDGACNIEFYIRFNP